MGLSVHWYYEKRKLRSVSAMREDQLLQRFSAKGSEAAEPKAKGSEAAFTELVRRNLDFVYSVCRRKVGDRELAEDITQSVFLLLAAKAGTLRPGTVLSGWLFQTAHLACRNALRTEARRQHYERQAMLEWGREMEHAARDGTSAPLGGGLPSSGSVNAAWGQIEPALDDALAQLSPTDRDAVLLRFVEELSPEEMAVALGISAAAAQKRVSRALARLRRGLQQTGAALSIAVISVVLAEKMVQAAPPAAVSGILAAASQAASGVTAQTHPMGGQAHFARWGKPAALTKAQGLLAATLLGAAGLCVIVFVSAPPQASSTAPKITASQQTTVPQKTITLHGSVVSAEGSPAANAAVTILRHAASDGAWSKFADARTDSAGRYTASGEGEIQQQDQWTVVADSGTRLGFGVPGTPCVLPPPTQIRLHLVGTDGRPLPGVNVQPLLLSGTDAAGRQEAVSLALGCPPRLITRTDSAGSAVFQGLPQGFVATFTVQDQAYQRRPPAADGLPLSAGAESGTYTVPVTLGASVTGRLVYGPARLPAAGVRVGAQETTTSAWGEAQTDAAGRYQINQLSPGRYTVAVDEQSAALGGGWTAAAVRNIVLGPGQEAACADMPLVRGVLITGTVTRRGSHRPVAGTEIGAYGPAHPAGGAWVGGGWTQADGTYQIRVPPGPQHVYPMALPGSAGADIAVPDGQKAVVNFALP